MSYGVPLIEQLSNGQIVAWSPPDDIGVPNTSGGSDPTTGVPHTLPGVQPISPSEPNTLQVAGGAANNALGKALGVDPSKVEATLLKTVQGWGLGIGLFLVALVLIAIGGKVLLEA